MNNNLKLVINNIFHEMEVPQDRHFFEKNELKSYIRPVCKNGF